MLPEPKPRGRRAEKRVARETNAVALRQAMLRRLRRRVSAKGHLRLPAVPALIDHYLNTIGSIFSAAGRPFSDGELAEVRAALEPQLKEGFERSPYAHVNVTYE